MFSRCLWIGSLFLLFSLLGWDSPDLTTSSKLGERLQSWLAERSDQDMVKIWIHFNDKGPLEPRELEQALDARRAELGERTLKRRAKMSSGSLVDERDLPLHPAYRDAVLALDPSLRMRAECRVVNAISAEAPVALLDRIAALDCVERIDKVIGFKRKALTRVQAPPPANAPAAASRLSYGDSWDQLNQISVPQLHDMGFTGNGVIVCMMDTGFYKDHEAFQALNVIAERDFINNDFNTQNEAGDPYDQHDHGTATWSALGGLKDGELYGPAYGADFLLAKTEDTSQEEPIEEDWWAAGIEWAEYRGADVVSSSLGYEDWYDFSDMDGQTCVTTQYANWAVSKGVVVVTAMGNNGQYAGSLIAPADSDAVISCGAVDSYGNITYFSSSGPTYDGRIKPDVCALGEYTYCASTWGTDYYQYTNGTSLSTPLIGGLAALLLEAHPDWTPDDVKQALHQTASNAGSPNNTYGWGIADAFDALHVQGLSLLDRDAFVLSETGGTADFSLNAGAANAGRYYALLGSVTGTDPGTDLPGGHATLPLVWDPYTDFMLTLMNSFFYVDFLGVLDGSGHATAQLNMPALPPGLVGLKMYYAYCCNNLFDFVSNPVVIEVVP